MIDKSDLFLILLRAKNITDEQMINWMKENPTKSIADCLITLSGADVISTFDNIRKIQDYYEKVGFVAAIKEYRNQFGVDLYSAKIGVEDLAEKNNWIKARN